MCRPLNIKFDYLLYLSKYLDHHESVLNLSTDQGRFNKVLIRKYNWLVSIHTNKYVCEHSQESNGNSGSAISKLESLLIMIVWKFLLWYFIKLINESWKWVWNFKGDDEKDFGKISSTRFHITPKTTF